MSSPLVVTTEGVAVVKFNPYHDKGGRFASSPWSSTQIAALDKKYAKQIKAGSRYCASAAKALEKDPSSRMLQERMAGAAFGMANIRRAYMKDLGLSPAEISKADKMVEEWGKGKMEGSALLRGMASGKDDALGAAATWTQSVLRVQGLDFVTVYRGVYGPQAEGILQGKSSASNLSIAARDAASWSGSKTVAERFAKGEFQMAGTERGRGAGAVLERQIKASEVLVHHVAFPDKFDWPWEAEYVVAGDGFTMASSSVSEVR